MDVALDNVDIQLAFCGRKEDALVYLELRKPVAAKEISNSEPQTTVGWSGTYLFYALPEQLEQGTRYPCLLARA